MVALVGAWTHCPCWYSPGWSARDVSNPPSLEKPAILERLCKVPEKSYTVILTTPPPQDIIAWAREVCTSKLTLASKAAGKGHLDGKTARNYRRTSLHRVENAAMMRGHATPLTPFLGFRTCIIQSFFQYRRKVTVSYVSLAEFVKRRSML